MVTSVVVVAAALLIVVAVRVVAVPALLQHAIYLGRDDNDDDYDENAVEDACSVS